MSVESSSDRAPKKCDSAGGLRSRSGLLLITESVGSSSGGRPIAFGRPGESEGSSTDAAKQNQSLFGADFSAADAVNRSSLQDLSVSRVLNFSSSKHGARNRSKARERTTEQQDLLSDDPHSSAEDSREHHTSSIREEGEGQNALFYTFTDPSVLTINDVPYIIQQHLGSGASAEVFRVEVLVPFGTRLRLKEDDQPEVDGEGRLLVEAVASMAGVASSASGGSTSLELVPKEDEAGSHLPCRKQLSASCPIAIAVCGRAGDKDLLSGPGERGYLPGDAEQEAAQTAGTETLPSKPTTKADDSQSIEEDRPSTAETVYDTIDDSKLIPSGASYALKIVQFGTGESVSERERARELQALHAYEIGLLAQLKGCGGIVEIYDSEVCSEQGSILILLELAICDLGTWLAQDAEAGTGRGKMRKLSCWDILGINLLGGRH